MTNTNSPQPPQERPQGYEGRLPTDSFEEKYDRFQSRFAEPKPPSNTQEELFETGPLPTDVARVAAHIATHTPHREYEDRTKDRPDAESIQQGHREPPRKRIRPILMTVSPDLRRKSSKPTRGRSKATYRYRGPIRGEDPEGQPRSEHQRFEVGMSPQEMADKKNRVEELQRRHLGTASSNEEE